MLLIPDRWDTNPTHSLTELSKNSSGPAPAVPRDSWMFGRCIVCALLTGIICLGRGVHADDVPAKLSFDRYHRMIDQSPFAVATAVVAPAAPPNFAKDLYVASAARSSDGVMVTIASTSDREFKKYLTSKAPVDGYAIRSIRWSKRVGKTTVTISKDGQLATLGFNQMLSVQPLPNRPPGAVQPPPSQPSVLQRPSRAVIQRNQMQSATPSPDE